MDIKETKKLLQRYGIRPSKRLAQSFLIDKRVMEKIIRAARLSKKDTVLEIGPGIGGLTIELAKRAARVIAVEKDPKMTEVLEETLRGFRNIKVVRGDILGLLPITRSRGYKVVANIPYYLTSPLIRKLLEAKNRPREMVLMVQKEVAQRITSHPPKMSLLAVSIQFYARPEIISFVSRDSFFPKPRVDSAIIRIVPAKTGLPPLSLRSSFFRIVRAGFSHPRKQLINNLSKGLNISRETARARLLKNKIGPSQRAESLDIDDWIGLARDFI